MGLDIYIIRGDAWPAYDRMIAHHHRLWETWERRRHDYRTFEVFSRAMARFDREHVSGCPEEWNKRPGGTVWGDDFYEAGYIARGCMIYGTELHDRYLWDIFSFRGYDYTPQDWPSVHREAERVLGLYRAGKAGTYDDPGTSARRILEYVVRLSGWILEEPNPDVYRACYGR